MRPDIRSERGSSTLELVIWAPVLLIVIGLLIVAGRLALAGNDVQSAAFAAAREASLARTPSTAQSAGESGANFSLDNSGINCISRSVTLDLSGFDTPLGTIGSVTATLTCTVNLGEAGIPGIPGTTVIERIAVSPVDPYRQRTP